MRKSNHNLQHLRQYRKNLRNDCTKAEAYLWPALRKKRIKGRRFRRQYSVGNYILDFYCPSEKLAIEVDGGIHDDPRRADYDARRTAYLETQGITVLRLKNEEVLTNRAGIVRYLNSLFDYALTQRCHPCPPISSFIKKSNDNEGNRRISSRSQTTSSLCRGQRRHRADVDR